MTPAIYSTERLNLLPMSHHHRAALVRLHSQPETMQSIGGVYSPKVTDEKIQQAEAHWLEHGFGLWVWLDKISSQLVGRGGLRYQALDDGRQMVELGYMVDKDRRRQGYATEVGRYYLELGFTVFGFEEIHAVTLPTNKISQQVMRKLGLEFETETVQFRGFESVLSKITWRDYFKD